MTTTALGLQSIVRCFCLVVLFVFDESLHDSGRLDSGGDEDERENTQHLFMVGVRARRGEGQPTGAAAVVWMLAVSGCLELRALWRCAR